MKRWCLGLLAGTALVWLTSPLFVRSYHSKIDDPISRDGVYPAGTAYRWRSEGYATTTFGPHGMPGRASLPEPTASRVIALWGDSQAEGVCVADKDKLWWVLQDRLSGGGRDSLQVLPLAHSGADAVDWTGSFIDAEGHLGVTEHFLLVCELDDLVSLAGPAPDSRTRTLGIPAKAMLDIVPDFVIHAARGLIFEGDSMAPRRLRFGLGPVAPEIETKADPSKQPTDFLAAEIAARLAGSTSRPITMLYAPQVPVIMGGEVRWGDPQDAAFESLARELRLNAVGVVDCRDALRNSTVSDIFPHGFQNGVIGNGHLNPAGYLAIADALMQDRRPEPTAN